MELRYQLLRDDAHPPQLATDGSLGFDLSTTHDVTMRSREVAMAGTGVAVEPPEGFGLLLMVRSGLARKQQVGLANGVGLIDEDYRGELIFALQNNSHNVRHIRAGERIGQLVLIPNYAAQTRLVEGALGDTARSSGGFGSTG